MLENGPLQKAISIIIPNYNGEDLLKRYLPYTLSAIEQEKVPFEIIVVDDASHDDSVNFLKRNFPNVKVIQNAENKGFSYTCNQGLRAATYPISLFLNSDIKLEKDYFSSQWAYFERDDTFGVMGSMLGPDGTRIEGAAKLPVFSGMKIRVNRQFYCNAKANTHVPTIFLSGANAMVSTEKMRELGGFDEIFSPYYSEDLDLSIRAWRLGWRCYYEHSARCYHLGQHTIKSSNKRVRIKEIHFRNRMVLHAIHTDRKNLSFYRIALLLFEVIPKFALGQKWIINSYREFRRLEPAIWRSRKKFERLMEKHQRNKNWVEFEHDFSHALKGLQPIYIS